MNHAWSSNLLRSAPARKVVSCPTTCAVPVLPPPRPRDAGGERGAPRLVQDRPHPVLDDARARRGRERDRCSSPPCSGGARRCPDPGRREEVRGREAAVFDEPRKRPAPTCSGVTRTGPCPIATEMVSLGYQRAPRFLSAHSSDGTRPGFSCAGRARRLAKTERVGDLGDSVHAEPPTQGVEVNVAGDLDRVTEVDPAVPALLVAPERASVERRVARAEDLLVRVHLPERERAVGQEDLEHRARRVHVLDRAVLQRVVRVGEKARPLRGRHPAREPVRIVGRGRHEGEDLPRPGVERDRGAHLVGERLLGQGLQLPIDREKKVLAGSRLEPAFLFDLPSVGVDDHAPFPVGSSQAASRRSSRCPSGRSSRPAGTRSTTSGSDPAWPRPGNRARAPRRRPSCRGGVARSRSRTPDAREPAPPSRRPPGASSSRRSRSERTPDSAGRDPAAPGSGPPAGQAASPRIPRRRRGSSPRGGRAAASTPARSRRGPIPFRSRT